HLPAGARPGGASIPQVGAPWNPAAYAPGTQAEIMGVGKTSAHAAPVDGPSPLLTANTVSLFTSSGGGGTRGGGGGAPPPPPLRTTPPGGRPAPRQPGGAPPLTAPLTWTFSPLTAFHCGLGLHLSHGAVTPSRRSRLRGRCFDRLCGALVGQSACRRALT